MTRNLGEDDEAFIKAISTAAEQYRQSLTAQYEARVKDLQMQHLEREKEQDAMIERLQKENHDLHSLLRQTAVHTSKPTFPAILGALGSGAPVSSTPKAISPPPVLHESASDTGLQTAYSKLLIKFQLVEGNFKKAKDLLERRKLEREHWANRTATLQDELEKLRSAGTQPLSAPPSAPQNPSCDLAATAHQRKPDGHTTGSRPDATRLRSTIPEPLPPSSPPVTARQTPGSTQSDPEDSSEVVLPPLPKTANKPGPSIKQEPSSDSPVVVSERSVRKRKRDPNQDDSTPAKIKVEVAADSSPIPRLDRFMLNSEGSLDLGDVAQRISTPRKRRDAAASDRWTPATEPQPPLALTRPQPGLYAKATTGVVRPSPLTPIDGNRRLGGVMTAKTSGTRRNKKDIEHGINFLAEDGISYGLNATPAGPNTGTPVAKGRLDDLLNTPSIGDRAPDISRSVARKLCKPATPRDDLLMPKPRELPFEKSALPVGKQGLAEKPEASPSVTRRSRSPKKRETATPQRKSGSLRNRPLSELKLDDFKINPQANEGVNYAFSDVVRGKGERAALPGCTDPHCCGEEFRALAISQRPNPPLTSEQRRQEQRLLEEYLGDHAYQLTAMTRQERTNVWIDAKTHELANKYGKHRHRYSRMRSPPGFWNADFPSTQEIEDEKLEAAKRERRTVEERRREAMRPGGRWVFRDE